jgi:cytochrome c peroxidase
MNNGATETLEEAVAIMGQEMLGREFDDSTINDITAFLHTLTGKMPDFEVPALP